MKNLAVFAVLAAVAIGNAAVVDPVQVEQSEAVSVSEAVVSPAVEGVDVVPTVSQNRNLNTGFPGTGDRLLHRNYYHRSPLFNAAQSQDITYRGNSNTRITAIRANEVGHTQYANARILSGGLNRNTVTIRLSSAVSYGYYFLVEIFGR